MTANIQQEHHIVETRGRATQLDTLIQGYRLCARTEGKSDKTILITTTALNKLRQFLESRGYPTDVIEIGTQELREFILYLQQVRAFEYHPYTRPQTRGLSGHAINTYLRSIRAFWSWLVREEVITSNPFSKVKVPKPPRKVIATFSEKQLNAIFKSVNTATPAGFRDWTMILMLLGLPPKKVSRFTVGILLLFYHHPSSCSSEDLSGSALSKTISKGHPIAPTGQKASQSVQ